MHSALLQVLSDRVGVVGLISEKGVRRLLGQIDQHVIALAIRCFPRREVEGDRPASGISETMNFTGLMAISLAYAGDIATGRSHYARGLILAG
jgi:hypothetical protein